MLCALIERAIAEADLPSRKLFGIGHRAGGGDLFAAGNGTLFAVLRLERRAARRPDHAEAETCQFTLKMT